MHQIKLDKAGKKATIDLNAFFYPLHVLQQSAASFSKIAKVSVKQEKDRAMVEITPKGKEKAFDTALHYCNYSLALKREFGEHA